MKPESELRNAIRAKVVDLARRSGKNASGIADDDMLLEKGLLDSASILELLVSLETQFDVELDPGELSLDNFGSISRMAQFLSSRSAG
jgi:acyl carrier protein